ncbi:hypothetical protein [Rossellomorea marisflavi]|uniref:hypothetical protein n=1 Tax=Rossellomorea marisflavi TaxID=189381 RepID=UPI00345B1182
MRLQEIKKILSDNIDKFDYVTNSINNGSTIEVIGHIGVINAINEIASLGFLDEELSKLKDLSTIYYDRSLEDRIQINSPTYNRFKNIIYDIYQKCVTVYKALNIAIPNQEEYSVSVKLPNYTELDCLPDFFEKLDKSLSQALVNKHFNGKITIEAFDSGSLWVVLSVGSHLALSFLGRITEIAVKISTLILDIKKENLHFQQMKTSQNFLKEYNEIQMQRLKKVTQKEAEALANDADITDPEYISQLQYAIKEISNLITEGTQFKPNEVTSPEETKHFPDYTQVTCLVESHNKLLEQFQSSNETEDDNKSE